MANAKKCDRCGKFYIKQTPLEMSVLENAANTLKESIDILLQKHTLDAVHFLARVQKECDFCPDCADSFKKWFSMNTKSKYEEEDDCSDV